MGMCLDSISASDYPKDRLELLIVDGMSDDQTRSIIQQYVDNHSYIHLYDNPRRIAPVAQNIGISYAKGDVIIIMDAHATYAPDYVSKCIKGLHEYDADYAGGIIKTVPRENTFVAKAIVCALSSSFGVGNAHYRTGHLASPIFTDAAAFGCYRREVFEQFGLFDERLARSYDFDFNRRVRKAGRGILLIPDAVIFYYARSTLGSSVKHNFVNGFYVTYPLIFGKRLFSIRHVVPLGFVIGLFGSAGISIAWNGGLFITLGIGGAYALANVVASARSAIKERDIRYLLLMPLIFFSMHLSYGLGSLWGLVKFIGNAVSRPINKALVRPPG